MADACKSSTNTKVIETKQIKQRHSGSGLTWSNTCVISEVRRRWTLNEVHPRNTVRVREGQRHVLAGQIAELAANFSKGLGRCWGRLYLDLNAAFDSILREFLDAKSTYDVRKMQSALKALKCASRLLKRLSPRET